MSKSTGIVLAAGSFAALDTILATDAPGPKLIQITVGTVGAALVSAGLDRVSPGLGTGGAALLLVAVLLDTLPRIAKAIQNT